MNNHLVIYGDFTPKSGYRTHALNFARALKTYCPVLLRGAHNKLDTLQLPESFHGMVDNKLSAVPDIAIGICGFEGYQRMVAHYRIGFVVFETTRIPREKLSQLHYLDEIWVPSQWCERTLHANGIVDTPITVVPEGVDTEVFCPTILNGLTANKSFRFLTVGKWEERKCQKQLIDLFNTVFQEIDDVELVVHAHNPFIKGFSLQREMNRSNLISPKVVASQPLDQRQLVNLYRSADAFVLPTRGEAWGLPILEAMACSLPVVATNYSGPEDFMGSEYAFPLPIQDLVKVKASDHYPAAMNYGYWAEPNWDILAGIMRYMYKNRSVIREFGEKARNHVVDNYTWDSAAIVAHRALQGKL